MANLLFKNARLVFPDRIEPRGDLRVADGRIAAIGPALTPEPGDMVQELGGRLLAPGFIDIHLHGALGRDAMEATSEAFEAICRHHATGGTTALALATVAAPTPAIVRVLDAAAAYRREPHDGAQLLGIHVEGPYFSPEKRGAHRPECLRNPTPADYAPLLERADALTQMTLAPELPGALALIEALRARGVRVSGGHSNAWDEEACAAFAHGMEGVTHTFNCMSSSRRRGPYRVAGLLEFALSEPGILCELIADGRHVSPTLMRMLYHAKGPEGIVLVTDATAGTGLPEKTPFQLGEIGCVVRDGVGLTAGGSALAGSTSPMIHLVRTLVQSAGVPLAEALRMASLNAARALSLPHKGALAPGADADLVLLSDTLEVVATFVQGRRVYRA
ncbi:MAG: N-acetylglucosamine-6-phosphate deacetylase [Verrucomicrobiota bacterium]